MNPLRRKGVVLGLSLAAVLVWACGEGEDVNGPLYPGQTEFTNNEPGSDGRHAPGGGMWNSNGESSDAKSGTPAPSGAPQAPGAPQGRTGEVEEADIYKVHDNKLFYLNTYRGFLIYDMTNAQSPKVVSRLPVYGYPIEMFIQKNTVYALIRDALYLTQVKGKLEFKRHNVSQLVAIDISDIKNPKILQTVDIIGQLREGVSRKIEDTVYVVSYISRYYYWGWNYGYNQNDQKEQAWVYSFNVKDPKNLKLVEKLKIFEGGGYAVNNKTTSESRYFDKVTISATSNALMVVENWRTYGYVKNSPYNCGSYKSQQQAIVSVVDISDEKGDIRLHTKFETYGELGDQFKQTYIFDEKTKKGTYLGIFARREWSSNDCSGSSLIKNTLESWDITNGTSPKRLDALAFGKPNETVRGSVFDSDREVAFAITARRVDPLYAISYQDPAQLKILSEVDGLSGDMNVFRFIADKKFLIGIGRDNSDTCKGFGSPTTGWSTKVAVSLIDVQDLNKIRLVQRECVAVKNASWVSSELNWNLDQAHKMIGMHSDGKVNVITVPVYYYKKSTDGWWYYGYETAVGMMTWDLTKYDPQKSHLDQTVLENYGTIIHPKGQVKRSIVFTHDVGQARRKVLNLSTTHISLWDVEDLTTPTEDAMIEVAPYHSELYRFEKGSDEYMVEHIRPQQYYYGGSEKFASEFRVKKVGGLLDQAPVVAKFSVGNVERVVPFNKKSLVIFRRVPATKIQNGKEYKTWEPEILVYSLADPTKPKQVSTLKVPEWFPSYWWYYPWYWFGDFGFWGGYRFDYYHGYYGTNGFTVTDKGMVFLTTTYDSKTKSYDRALAFIDLTDLANPGVKDYPLSSSQSWYFYGLVGDPTDTSSFYLTYKVKTGTVTFNGDTFYQYKYYAQRWSWGKSGWVAGAAVNLPGRLMKVWKNTSGQRLFLTHDYTYKKVWQQSYYTWQHSFRINLLKQVTPWGQPLAELLDSHNFGGYYLRDAVLDGNNLFVNARMDYYTQKANKIPWSEVSDHLLIFDLSNLSLAKRYSAPTGTYQVQMMGTHDGKLFLNLPGDGVLAVDVSNPEKPVGQQFLRTLGYATHLEFSKDNAYVCSGYFGVYQMKLSSSPLLAYQ
jgi:hypothetical protein